MKKILFITGTRADFGKVRSLIESIAQSDRYSVSVFVTGMHMLRTYGETYLEVKARNYPNTYYYINQNDGDSNSRIIANTIQGLSSYLDEFVQDLVVIHGDRIEAIAAAITCALKNIRVAHIEGGEISGTIDDSIRHAVSKFSHVHLVANESSYNRLVQLGEDARTIFKIGSPEVDLLTSESLPSVDEVLRAYEIPFDTYNVAIFHSVLTEIEELPRQIKKFVDEILVSTRNFVVIFPNNDLGASVIIKEYERLKGQKNIRIFPSVRFESFVTLMRNAKSVIGNSSAGVREAPIFGVPSVNIGSRQTGRAVAPSIKAVTAYDYNLDEILSTLEGSRFPALRLFGDGTSGAQFRELLDSGAFWSCPIQKTFVDLD